jgi:hypothetical protein
MAFDWILCSDLQGMQDRVAGPDQVIMTDGSILFKPAWVTLLALERQARICCATAIDRNDKCLDRSSEQIAPHIPDRHYNTALSSLDTAGKSLLLAGPLFMPEGSLRRFTSLVCCNNLSGQLAAQIITAHTIYVRFVSTIP